MTNKNLVPMPNPDRRSGRLSRVERRQRFLAKRQESELAGVDGDADEPEVERLPQKSVERLPRRARAKAAPPQPAPQSAPQPAPMADPTPIFALPPRAQLAKTASLFTRVSRWSFILGVLGPTVCVILFYVFVASPQYATHSMFAVRGSADSSGAMDQSSLFAAAGGSAGTEIADSFIVQEYILSRSMVEALISEANFLEIYSRPSADPYYRLDPTIPIEGLVKYWQMMATVDYDLETGILTLIVRAFRPSDAEAITRKVIEKSEKLVNEISLRAREDSVRSAQREVDLAEGRYADARKAVSNFRGNTKDISPERTAEGRQGVVVSLESEVAKMESQLTALLTTMSENSPRVVYIRNQIAALEQQIEAERRRATVTDEGNDQERVLTERLSEYEELVAEREFALNQYSASYETLEAARVEALKQQRYLTVFVRGEAPEEATYPEAVRWTAIVAATCFMMWGFVMLVAAGIRDRRA